MMASRNSDVDDLNRRAHQLMADHGHLHGEALHLDGRPFQIGDRVVCLRNDRRLGVRNGTVGDITHIDHQHRTLTIDTPDGTRRRTGRVPRRSGMSVMATPSPSTKPKASRVTTRCCSAATSSTESPATSDSPAAANRTGSTPSPQHPTPKPTSPSTSAPNVNRSTCSPTHSNKHEPRSSASTTTPSPISGQVCKAVPTALGSSAGPWTVAVPHAVADDIGGSGI